MPREMIITPADMVIFASTPGFFAIQVLALPAKIPQALSEMNAKRLKVRPRISSCSGT